MKRTSASPATHTAFCLYTCTRAVLRLINKEYAGDVLGVAIAITNMKTVSNASVLAFYPGQTNNPISPVTLTVKPHS